jgi:hypothetical protein
MFVCRCRIDCVFSAMLFRRIYIEILMIMDTMLIQQLSTGYIDRLKCRLRECCDHVDECYEV